MARTEEDIRQDILEQLLWDYRVDAADIQVNVEGGIVSLRGSVPTLIARHFAHADCADGPGRQGRQQRVDRSISLEHHGAERRGHPVQCRESVGVELSGGCRSRARRRSRRHRHARRCGGCLVEKRIPRRDRVAPDRGDRHCQPGGLRSHDGHVRRGDRPGDRGSLEPESDDQYRRGRRQGGQRRGHAHRRSPRPGRATGRISCRLEHVWTIGVDDRLVVAEEAEANHAMQGELSTRNHP